MNIRTFPVADGYEIDFISKVDGVPPQIEFLSHDDDPAMPRFVVEIQHFSGKISLRRTLQPPVDATRNQSTPEQPEERATDAAMNRVTSEEDFSQGNVSQSGRSESGGSLPEHTPKRSESPRLPPRIEIASDGKIMQTRSNSGGSVVSATQSKSKVLHRMSSPSTMSPSFVNQSSKSHLPWDSQNLLKSLKKPIMQKSQSRGLSGLLLRKSIIPNYIRENRNIYRGYFYRDDDKWCDESGKIASPGDIEALLQRISSKQRSEKSLKKSISELDQAKMLAPPTKLHALCGAPHINYEDVELELDERPEDTSVLDDRLRTPLHVLADNDALFLDPQGRFTVIAVMARLVQIYPEAITIKDVSGNMPFMSLIEDWCSWVYDAEEEDRSKKRADATNLFSLSDEQVDEQQQGISRRMSVNHVSRTAAQVTAGAKRTAIAGATKVIKFLDEKIIRTDSLFHDSIDGVSKGATPKAGRLHPQVKLWDEVYFAFEMISEIFDQLAGKNGGVRKIQYEGDPDGKEVGDKINSGTNDESSQSGRHRTVLNLDQQTRSEYASHLVERLPYLWKTILLIDDSNLRNVILEMPLFHRLRLVPNSIGPWLTNMLRKQGTPAKRAVDFILIISKANSPDLTGGFRSDTREDLYESENLRQETFAKLEGLKGTIASLVVLDTKDVERAATSNAVWHLMNRNLTRPFVVGLMLVDIVLHITLMLAVRTSVGLQSTGNASSAVGEAIPAQVALFICTFYIIRKGAEAMALFNLSPIVFRAYVVNMWTILDFLTVILTLCAVSWNKRNPGEYRNGFNAAVVGLLWLKVLGILKVVNKHMSTFVMAVTKILNDLKYFAIVLFVVIFMVGDMMSIAVATKDNGAFCNTDPENLDETLVDFCSSNQMAAYLRIYALLLGDFDLDSYKETSGMVFLFFLFTIVGVVILLNVLIAVIDDSYERAKISGRNLFGRARVEFVALNEALEAFLRPGAKPMDNVVGSATKAFFTLFYIGRWLVLISMISTALNAEIFHASRAIVAVNRREDYFNLIVAVVLFVMLSAGLLIMIIFAFEHIVKQFAPGWTKTIYGVFQYISEKIVRVGAWYIFGVREVSVAGVKEIDTKDAEGDEWNGRLHYMEVFIQKSLDQTKEDISLQVEELEKRLTEKQALL